MTQHCRPRVCDYDDTATAATLYVLLIYSSCSSPLSWSLYISIRHFVHQQRKSTLGVHLQVWRWWTGRLFWGLPRAGLSTGRLGRVSRNLGPG
ncbi:hypothetical protein TNCV_1893691 [Trichonephila clavipes]|nr:hypothetical protein TNCV_1893691 [Trichonephila clavipes]